MNLLSIEIKDANVESRNIKGAKGSFDIYQQTGWAFTGDQYPEKCVIQVPAANQGYAAGHYHVDAQNSVQIGSFGALEFKRQLTLVPVKK